MVKFLINKMNKINYTIVLIVFLISCVDDSEHGPYGTDNTAPGPVSINQVVNTPGGAVIYFTPPTDEDLLVTVKSTSTLSFIFNDRYPAFAISTFSYFSKEFMS